MYQAGIYCRVSIEEQNKEGEYSIILQNRMILQKQEFMQMMDFPEAILTEQNSEECWQILNWGRSIW